MKKIIISFLALAMILSSCVLNGDEGGASGSVSGTITNTGAYSNLKIGFFPAFGATAPLDEDDQARSGGGLQAFLYYDDIDDGSDEAITPAEFDSVTAGSYSFSLPSSPQVSTSSTNYYYYLAVWADADDDNILDLLNRDWFNTSNPGEYSRLPLKDLGGTNPAYTYSWYYQEDDSYTGYKYNGYDGGTSYAANQLTDATSGFNFELD